MRAAVYSKYGSPDVLQIKEIEKPTPKENEILVRIHKTVVTPVDTAAREGVPLMIRFFNGFLKPKNPILGSVVAGEIQSVGKNVTRFRIGDQVFGESGSIGGTHAEYISLPEDVEVIAKPAQMSFDEAAAICEGVLTALPFLRDHADIKAGQSILINGASGSIGTAAVQLAKYFGAHVTAVCSSANHELVNSLGADEVIDYTKEDFTKLDQEYDIIFDAIGKSSFSKCRSALKEGGIYLSTVPSLRIFIQTVWTTKIGSKHAVFAATGLRPTSERKKDLEILNRLFEAGSLRAVIDRSYPLEQIAEAYRYIDMGHKKGNVIIDLS